jgi:hypothetical protein
MLKPHCSNIYLRYCFAHLLRRLAEKVGLAFSILLLNLYALVFFAHCQLPIGPSHGVSFAAFLCTL